MDSIRPPRVAGKVAASNRTRRSGPAQSAIIIDRPAAAHRDRFPAILPEKCTMCSAAVFPPAIDPPTDQTARQTFPFPPGRSSDVSRHFQADYPRPLTLSDIIRRKKSWSGAICLTSQVILAPKSSAIRTDSPFPTIIGRIRSCRQPHFLWGCENRPLPRLFEEIRCSKKVSLSFLFCSHTLI